MATNLGIYNLQEPVRSGNQILAESQKVLENDQALEQNRMTLADAMRKQQEAVRQQKEMQQVRDYVASSIQKDGHFDLQKHGPGLQTISPTAYQQFSEGVAKTAHLQAQTKKQEADAQKQALEQAQARMNDLHMRAERIKALPPEQQAEAYKRERAAALASGIHGDYASQIPEEFPGLDQLSVYNHSSVTPEVAQRMGFETKKEERAAAKETRDAEKFKLEKPGVQADATKKVLETNSQLAAGINTPEGWKQFYDAQPPEIQSKLSPNFSPEAVKVAVQMGIAPKDAATIAHQEQTAKETARHNRTTESQGAARIGMEKQKLGFEMNGGVSPMAQAMVDGTADEQTVRSAVRKNPSLLAQAKQLDPDFDMADLGKKTATGKEFASSSNSKAGGQVIALNTMVHHADLYMDAAQALKNGTFKPGNAIYNKLATMFGSAPPNNSALIAQFLAAETGKVATGGVPAEGEVKRILQNLGTNASPQQLEDAGKMLLQIGLGRAKPLQEKIEDAKLQKQYRVFGEDSRAILQKHGFDPDTMKAKAATGSAGSLPKGGGKAISKDIAKQFYDAAGGDPKKAQKMAEDAGWKVQ